MLKDETKKINQLKKHKKKTIQVNSPNPWTQSWNQDNFIERKEKKTWFNLD